MRSWKRGWRFSWRWQGCKGLKVMQKRTAEILDIETFEEMLEIIDDYYCTKAYDESKPKVDAEIK